MTGRCRRSEKYPGGETTMWQGKGIYYTHIQLGLIKTTVVLKEECRNQSGYGKYEHSVHTWIHFMSQQYELPVNTNSLSGQQHQQLRGQYYFLAMSAKNWFIYAKHCCNCSPSADCLLFSSFCLF